MHQFLGAPDPRLLTLSLGDHLLRVPDTSGLHALSMSTPSRRRVLSDDEGDCPAPKHRRVIIDDSESDAVGAADQASDSIADQESSATPSEKEDDAEEEQGIDEEGDGGENDDEQLESAADSSSESSSSSVTTPDSSSDHDDDLYIFDDDDETDISALPVLLWCRICCEEFPPDSFSAKQQKQANDLDRFCLRRTSASGYGRTHETSKKEEEALLAARAEAAGVAAVLPAPCSPAAIRDARAAMMRQMERSSGAAIAPEKWPIIPLRFPTNCSLCHAALRYACPMPTR